MMEYNDVIFVNDGKEILPRRTKSNNKGLPLIQAWCKIFILLKSTCKTSVALFEIQQFLAHILRVGCVLSSSHAVARVKNITSGEILHQ